MTLLIIAFFVTMAVVRFSHTHAHLTLAGVQKLHSSPVPRVGGLGIVCAVVVGAGLLHWRYPSVGAAPWLLVACGMPAFLSGITEDVTKSVSPRRRLAFTVLSAVQHKAIRCLCRRATFGIEHMDALCAPRFSGGKHFHRH